MEEERAHDDMGDNNNNENTNNKCVNKATADEAKAAWQLQLHFHLLVEGIGSFPGMQRVRLHADCVSVCLCRRMATSSKSTKHDTHCSQTGRQERMLREASYVGCQPQSFDIWLRFAFDIEL